MSVIILGEKYFSAGYNKFIVFHFHDTAMILFDISKIH